MKARHFCIFPGLVTLLNFRLLVNLEVFLFIKHLSEKGRRYSLISSQIVRLTLKVYLERVMIKDISGLILKAEYHNLTKILRVSTLLILSKLEFIVTFDTLILQQININLELSKINLL